MRSFAFALIATLMALFSVAAAGKCRVSAGSTTSPGPTGWLHVWDANGKKIGRDASLLCYTGSAKQLKEAKEGTKVADKNSITVKAGLAHDVSVQVTCDGPYVDTCAFQYGDVKSDSIQSVKRYARGQCDFYFDC